MPTGPCKSNRRALRLVFVAAALLLTAAWVSKCDLDAVKVEADRALHAAQSADQKATQALKSAQPPGQKATEAENDAKAADDKASRMFHRSLRKQPGRPRTAAGGTDRAAQRGGKSSCSMRSIFRRRRMSSRS